MWPGTAHANSIVAITGIGITRIPVVAKRCETIPVIIRRTPERSKPTLLEFTSGEKPALLAAKVPALLEDPSGEKPTLLAAKVLSVEKPALVAASCQHGHRSEKCDELQHDGLL
jgi:hypothetical protein